MQVCAIVFPYLRVADMHACTADATQATKGSEFLVFDALTMGAKPIAKVILPQRVPFGFHALYVPEEQLKAQTMGQRI